MTKLEQKKCVPCEGGTPPLTGEAIKQYTSELTTPWEVIDEKKLQREFKFKDFKEGMEFVNKVAEIAEQEQHHPDITIHYNRISIELSTHSIKGLSENDFILAAKINQL